MTLLLRTDVTLTSLRLDHVPTMYRWMGDPAVRDNLGLRSEPTLERTAAWVKNAADDATICAWAILLQNQHIGNVILDRIDGYLGTARLSVYVGEASARGSGVGLTAIYLALVEGFQTLNLHKVWLTVHSRNFAAMNTYTRLGFTLEGILRDEFLLGGQRVPAFYMGLLRAELEALKVERSEAN